MPGVVVEDRLRDAALAPARRRLARRVEQRAVVLDEPFERLLGEVQAVEIGVAALEFGDDAAGRGCCGRSRRGRHAGVERVLAGMAERRMAEVVAERDRLGEIVVETSARASARAIWATSIVWVSRVRKWSPS